MTNLPTEYFGDIPATVMQEIADGMEGFERGEFGIAQCEGRNHAEHQGELWQCRECLRVFCWEEGGDDQYEVCVECASRVRVRNMAPAFA